MRGPISYSDATRQCALVIEMPASVRSRMDHVLNARGAIFEPDEGTELLAEPPPAHEAGARLHRRVSTTTPHRAHEDARLLHKGDDVATHVLAEARLADEHRRHFVCPVLKCTHRRQKKIVREEPTNAVDNTVRKSSRVS